MTLPALLAPGNLPASANKVTETFLLFLNADFIIAYVTTSTCNIAHRVDEAAIQRTP